MITIITDTSTIPNANGIPANGTLTITPTASFSYDTFRVSGNAVVVNIVDGKLENPLELHPCQGVNHQPAGVVYQADFNFGQSTDTQYWLLSESVDGTQIEILDVQLVNSPTLPTFTVLKPAANSAKETGGNLEAILEILEGATPETNTVTRVAANVAVQTLLAANPDRVGACFYNETTTGKLKIKHGAGAGAADYTVLLNPGDFYELAKPVYTGIITGIWSVADGAVQCTEGE